MLLWTPSPTNFRFLLCERIRKQRCRLQGAYQGLSDSIRSTMRFILALQTMAPVIFTEMGQYCCNANGAAKSCQQPAMCIDHTHGDNYVWNLLNLAAQYDCSWVGWGWRGTNANDGNCTDGEPICNSPDMRSYNGTLTNGTEGGADWATAWAAYVSSSVITVQDNPTTSLNSTAYEVQGFLPRPCIVGQFGLGDYCGYPLNTSFNDMNWVSFWNSSQGTAVLPGLPPAGPPSACLLQACPGYTCQTTSPIIPMPNPCGV
jgi:hypothetical protein